jgi:ribosomal protein S18 acetylase RimI-like enzyme
MRRIAGVLLRRVQASSLYRRMARRVAGPFSVVEASPQDLECVAAWLNPAWSPTAQAPDPDVRNWVARRRGSVVGFVQVVRGADVDTPWDGYWIFSLQVKPACRGFGIGEALARQALAQVAAEGGREVRLAVYPDRAGAAALYRKLGFVPVTVPALEPLFAEELAREGRRRVVLSRKLGGRQDV